MFFFFNYKHYSSVPVTVANPPAAGTSPTDSADYVRPVTTYKKRKRRKTYAPPLNYRKFPVKPNTVTLVETPTYTPEPTPPTHVGLQYLDNPIEYQNRDFTITVTVPDIKPIVKIVDIPIITPKKKSPKRDYSKVEIVKPKPVRDNSFIKVIEDLVKAEQEKQLIKELENYVLQLKEKQKRIEEEKRIQKEREEIEEVAFALIAAGEEDLAASLLFN